MVRLVFRPYTQVRRSICTSESLRTSIRVSPDFILPRHSSPSFGSQRMCSNSVSSAWLENGPAVRLAQRARILPLWYNRVASLAFTVPSGVYTQRPAHVLNSLVRVSRRDRWKTVYSPPGTCISRQHKTSVLQRIAQAKVLLTPWE